ncbi:MAG: hypothetical protein FWD73_00915 [Polyangiaceae bacterium]|nr:hypothetical protein [Polyangiaceae bacterium]
MVVASIVFASSGRAAVPTARRGISADRVAVRYVTPETGGMARPRFVTDRTLALFARFEAMTEQVPMPEADYPERYVRSALDRLIARSMLASLLSQRRIEPPDLPGRVDGARAELAARVGGSSALDAAMKREGIDDEELTVLLREQVRAAFYIDKAIVPILAVTEDALREAYRSAAHPYRNVKYEDVRDRLRLWVATERQRAAELEFLQSTRARISIFVLHPIGAVGAPAPSQDQPVVVPPVVPRP